MSVKVAINGFGRIGRLVLRVAQQYKGVDIVAINDLSTADHLAYLLKYDSTHGRFEDVYAEGNVLHVGKNKITILSERDPSNLPWKELEVDFVIESTGLFTTMEGAQKHLSSGARRVIISAPAKDEVATFVMGVNHTNFDPKKHFVVSNASCTTNCLAPMTKVLLDNFGIEEGLMTTIHAVTANQPTVDGPSKKDWRGGRAAFENIIPSSTGAAKAVALCLPEVKGKLTGMAFRVPVVNVSVVDLTVKLSKSTSYEGVCDKMLEASENSMQGVLHYCDEPLVSSDFIGSTYSSIFDKGAGIGLNSTFFKLVAWYDNEMGYANRLVDLAAYMASKE